MIGTPGAPVTADLSAFLAAVCLPLWAATAGFFAGAAACFSCAAAFFGAGALSFLAAGAADDFFAVSVSFFAFAMNDCSCGGDSIRHNRHGNRTSLVGPRFPGDGSAEFCLC